MKAVRFDQYGDRDVLYIAELEVPQPGPGEVLVEVRAAGDQPGRGEHPQGLPARAVAVDLPLR